jgi:hypothetical protein
MATGSRELDREHSRFRAAKDGSEAEPVPGAPPFIGPGFPLPPLPPPSAFELNPLEFTAGGLAITHPAESAEPLSDDENVEPNASPKRIGSELGPLGHQLIEAVPAIVARLISTGSVSQPGTYELAPPNSSSENSEADRPPTGSAGLDLKAAESHRVSEVLQTDPVGDVAFRMRLSYRDQSHEDTLTVQAEQSGESQRSAGADSGRGSSPQVSTATSDRKTRQRSPGTSNAVASESPAVFSNDWQAPIEPSPPGGGQASSVMGSESHLRPESPLPVPVATHDPPCERPKPAPLRELSLKLPGNAGMGVDLHIMDYKGKLHVEVRTGDAHLAASLQENVGDLVSKLDRSGYHTEEVATRHGGRVITAPGDAQQGNNDNVRQSGAERDQTAGQGGQSGQQHHHGQGRGNRPRWLEEIVKTFDPQVREEENQD